MARQHPGITERKSIEPWRSPKMVALLNQAIYRQRSKPRAASHYLPSLLPPRRPEPVRELKLSRPENES